MEKSELLKRYSVFTLGLYFLSMGIVLIVRSGLGTTPISSLNYVVSLNTPLTLGTCTFIINVLLMIGQFMILGSHRSRKDTVEILLQIPFSFIFSVFIDFNMWLSSGVSPSAYWGALVLLFAGCLVQGIGVVLELKPGVSMMSAEAFVNYASRRFNKDFGKFKVGFDVALVTMAIALSLILAGSIQGVREGSLIAACSTGYIVSFLGSKVMTGKNLRRLRSAIPGRH